MYLFICLFVYLFVEITSFALSEPESEPEPEPAPPAPKVTAVKTTGKLVFPPNPHWYTALPPLAPPTKPLSTPSTSQISSLTETASALLAADAAATPALLLMGVLVDIAVKLTRDRPFRWLAKTEHPKEKRNWGKQCWEGKRLE